MMFLNSGDSNPPLSRGVVYAAATQRYHSFWKFHSLMDQDRPFAARQKTRTCLKTSCLVFVMVMVSCVSLAAEEPPKNQFTTRRKVRDVVKLLVDAGHHPVVLCGSDSKKIVVVAPSLVGRVICTGSGGLHGTTDSYISEDQIAKGFTKSLPGAKWASFGGEERVWLAPEGGEYALFFSKGKPQTQENYTVPESLNSTKFQVTEISADGKSVTFTAGMSLVNFIGSRFDLEVSRTISLVESCPYVQEFKGKIDFVGFESHTYIKNIGKKPWTKKTGAMSIWTIGQFLAKDNSVVIMPYRCGSNEVLGAPVSTEYFRLLTLDGNPTPRRFWTVENNVVLLKASGVVQTKLELMAKRSLGRIAAIDLKGFVMNILDFDFYPELEYVASYPLPYDGNPYVGGAASTFVLSKLHPVSPSYELECCSPALFLQPGEKFGHVARTYRLRSDKNSLITICKRYFNADIKTLTEFDRRSSMDLPKE